MTKAETALRRCLDPDEYDTVARFVVETDSDVFSIEFGAHVTDPPVWNIARDPPVGADDFEEFFVVDSGRNYVVVDSTAKTADEAADELLQLASLADANSVDLVKTFSGGENPVKDLKKFTRHYVIKPIRGLVR